MTTNKPIQRGSWGLEMGQPLFLPSEHPGFAHRECQDPDLRPEDVYLRVDWQTLRRLPLSGAVVFNFKALFTPLTEFKDEPYIPSLVLKVLNEGKENIIKYKGTWHVEHVAKPTLRAYEEHQVENGLIERDWDVHTLPEAPFFRGWERKWTVE
ncbi:mannosyl transferase [Colletotrichum higginsianum]|nr:mannosyl transferase [Colletotrichum higginsianum]